MKYSLGFNLNTISLFYPDDLAIIFLGKLTPRKLPAPLIPKIKDSFKVPRVTPINAESVASGTFACWAAWEYVIAATVGLLVAAAASLVTRGGVGMGDAKLCFLLGAGLGWSVLAALFVGSLGAAIASIVIIARHGMTARKQTIPFGPFLALGGIVVVFFA